MTKHPFFRILCRLEVPMVIFSKMSFGKSAILGLGKKHRNGKVTYYHQMLGAVAVHPEQATVFAVATKEIVKQGRN